MKTNEQINEDLSKMSPEEVCQRAADLLEKCGFISTITQRPPIGDHIQNCLEKRFASVPPLDLDKKDLYEIYECLRYVREQGIQTKYCIGYRVELKVEAVLDALDMIVRGVSNEQ